MTSSDIVQKVWNYCHVLRDDGVGYLDYVEQLACLLFLKMDDGAASLSGHKGRSAIPKEYGWQALLTLTLPPITSPS